MILADTSVWIELLNRRPAPRLDDERLLRLVTCGPVVQEVLQGFRAGTTYEEFRASFLALPKLSDPLGLGTFLHGAEIYREGRKRGLTIRSSTDCLIAAIAIENRAAVWHRDRDYVAIARYTALQLFEGE